MMYRPDNKRHARFIAEYLVDLNGTQAAIRAGFATAGAAVTASRLLREPNIQDEIARRMALRGKRLEITAESVVREIARLAFSELRKAVRWSGGKVALADSEALDPDTAAAIVEVAKGKYGIRIKLADKVRALELLGRHLGIFVEREQEAGRFVLFGEAEAADAESWAAQYGPGAPASPPAIAGPAAEPQDEAQPEPEPAA